MKLYNLYNVISNKTVRRHEKKYDGKTDRPKHKYMLGRLVKTGRGYFIDGHEVDLKAVETYRALNNNESSAKVLYDEYHEELKRLEALKEQVTC